MTKRSNNIDLNSFKRDRDFYANLDLLLTVKSFDLQQIRKRYLQSLKNKSGKRGSVERREPAMGGLVSLSLSGGKIKEEKILKKLPEPRGISVFGELLAFSSEKNVFIFSGDEMRHLTNPWFSYIHTLDFSEDGKNLLVSSSGFDAVFEYDTKSLKQNHEWFAWEHGLSKGTHPETGESIFLSRKAADKGREHFKVISDPLQQELPTAMRAAFINSVEYDKLDNNYFIATLFHLGQVIRIGRLDGSYKVMMEGLTNPHGGRKFGDALMATSTGSGELVVEFEDEKRIYSFCNLPGKEEALSGREWIQNSVRVGDLIISIDSNRQSFVVFSLRDSRIDIIPFNPDWAVQDLVVSGMGAAIADLFKFH